MLHRSPCSLKHTFVTSLAFPLHATQESVQPKAHLCDVSRSFYSAQASVQPEAHLCDVSRSYYSAQASVQPKAHLCYVSLALIIMFCSQFVMSLFALSCDVSVCSQFVLSLALTILHRGMHRLKSTSSEMFCSQDMHRGMYCLK
jgi:hypothetical protein